MIYRSSNLYKVLQVFFDEPNKIWHLREISREVNISHPSVKSHLLKLIEEDLIESNEDGLYKGYRAVINDKFRTYKVNDLLIRLKTSGLIDLIKNQSTPNCLVLFGSAASGRDDTNGDIDLFIQSKKTNLNLNEYEEKLNRKINLLYEPDIDNVNEELRNSLANGIVLHGFLKVI
ncbi:MAG: winged helix-turn-helix domain-containing protein [Thermoplasmata archaeon]